MPVMVDVEDHVGGVMSGMKNGSGWFCICIGGVMGGVMIGVKGPVDGVTVTG